MRTNICNNVRCVIKALQQSVLPTDPFTYFYGGLYLSGLGDAHAGNGKKLFNVCAIDPINPVKLSHQLPGQVLSRLSRCAYAKQNRQQLPIRKPLRL